MTEMCAAILANHFGAMHAEAVSVVKLDIRQIGWFGKARPAGTGIELCIG